jgi:hypothetical protein
MTGSWVTGTPFFHVARQLDDPSSAMRNAPDAEAERQPLASAW